MSNLPIVKSIYLIKKDKKLDLFQNNIICMGVYLYF